MALELAVIQMFRPSRGVTLALLLAAHSWAGAAVSIASPYELSLTGDVAALATSSFVSSGRQFDTGVLLLSGLSAFSVQQGDTIDATITLSNGPFMLPASPEQFFGFNLTNNSNTPPDYDPTPGLPLLVEGSYSFTLGAVTVYTPSNANCGNCASLISFAGPGSLVQFDAIQLHMTFGNLTAPYAIDGASISYQLSQAVPEPAEWALMLGGLLAVGAVARRRQA